MYRAEATAMEFPLCKADELQNGEMREFQVEGAKIVLVKDQDKFFAVSGKCTHYGAPLAKGSYCNGRIRCPWHGACFNVHTGDIEDHPGNQSLSSYPVEIKNGEVFLHTATSALADTKSATKMSKCIHKDSAHTVVIVGGGGAGISCAETLRREGFNGRVVIITQEPSLPYDRPKLSKALTSSAESLYLHPPEFYAQHDIEVVLNKKVVSVSVDQKEITFENGERLTYGKLILCTGGKPRALKVPGAEFDGVFLLRTPSDGNRIAQQSEGKNLVVLGTSFIGMEVAATLAKKCLSVTVVGTSEVPFQQAFGKEIGSAFLKLFEKNGVKFRLGVSIKECQGVDGKLSQVILTDGSALTADVCVTGIGVEPSTEFLRNSGIQMDQRGFIKVDKHLKTNIDSVYACGDICVFPLEIFGSVDANVQHWQMSLKHGHVAAKNIVGKSEPVKSVPFFWSAVFGKSLRYTGYGAGFDDLLIHGSLDELQFVAYFLKRNRLVAVATMQRDPVAANLADLFFNGCEISRADIERNEKDEWSPQQWTLKSN